MRPGKRWLVAVLVLAVGCKEPFGPFDNPVDPTSTHYQGHETVASLADVEPLSPAKGASLTYLVFSCLPCSVAETYAMQIATTAADFEETKVCERTDFATNTMVLSAADAKDLAVGTYYWRVGARASSTGQVAWSDRRSVVLSCDYGTVAPVDGGTTIDTTPLLDWSDVTVGYEVQVAESARGLSSVVPVAASRSQYQVPLESKFAYGKTCYWRVRAINEDDVPCAWSSTFTAAVSWDVSYTAVSPEDAGNTIDTTPLLDWATVDGAASYEVEFAASSSGLSSATPVVVSTSEYQVPLESKFTYGTTCFWRVRAINEDYVPWAWSSTFSAAVSWDVSYEAVSPADGGGTFDTMPLLEWVAVEGAASYEVATAATEVELDGASAEATAGPSHQVAAALAAGTWYWRVRALNEDGVLAPAGWSTTWSYGVTDLPEGFALVRRGTFNMGESGVAAPVHRVTVSEFAISRQEVTQAEYLAVVGSNPAYFTEDTSHPVEQVDWYDAVVYCNAFSAADGLSACYTIDGTTVSTDWRKNGYRLPTEAEWEFAARGGTSSEGYAYCGSDTVGDVAWYRDNSDSTNPVGTKDPNELNIYDMSGNVCEWCWDWYGSYSSEPQTDPTGSSSGSTRVLRGGNWGAYAIGVRVASRDGSASPGYTDNGVGFRVARRAGP